ncbi:MAG: hypothetical protein IJB48_05765 [Clostridia bacterium]|nr:hypothetical protein [Clostridia bacterium]MBQ4143019.1 hypothetical protein [Thermoguttaceae bacterium]
MSKYPVEFAIIGRYDEILPTDHKSVKTHKTPRKTHECTEKHAPTQLSQETLDAINTLAELHFKTQNELVTYHLNPTFRQRRAHYLQLLALLQFQSLHAEFSDLPILTQMKLQERVDAFTHQLRQLRLSTSSAQNLQQKLNQLRAQFTSTITAILCETLENKENHDVGEVF